MVRAERKAYRAYARLLVAYGNLLELADLTAMPVALCQSAISACPNLHCDLDEDLVVAEALVKMSVLRSAIQAMSIHAELYFNEKELASEATLCIGVTSISLGAADPSMAAKAIRGLLRDDKTLLETFQLGVKQGNPGEVLRELGAHAGALRELRIGWDYQDSVDVGAFGVLVRGATKLERVAGLSRRTLAKRSMK